MPDNTTVYGTGKFTFSKLYYLISVPVTDFTQIRSDRFNDPVICFSQISSTVYQECGRVQSFAELLKSKGSILLAFSLNLSQFLSFPIIDSFCSCGFHDSKYSCFSCQNILLFSSIEKLTGSSIWFTSEGFQWSDTAQELIFRLHAVCLMFRLFFKMC